MPIFDRVNSISCISAQKSDWLSSSLKHVLMNGMFSGFWLALSTQAQNKPKGKASTGNHVLFATCN